MNIVETEDLWVLSAHRRLTIPQVKAAAAELCPLIDADVAAWGMEAQEPWLFIAQNLPKNSKSQFDWQCCRPVRSPKAYEGMFALLHLEPIMVATATHQGPVRTLFTQGYRPLVAAIEQSRHAFSGESRELYHRFDGPEASYQKIEIQFGLAY